MHTLPSPFCYYKNCEKMNPPTQKKEKQIYWIPSYVKPSSCARIFFHSLSERRRESFFLQIREKKTGHFRNILRSIERDDGAREGSVILLPAWRRAWFARLYLRLPAIWKIAWKTPIVRRRVEGIHQGQTEDDDENNIPGESSSMLWLVLS